METPVIVELVTGGLVESVHRGAVAVVDASGHRRSARGDVDRPLPAWPGHPPQSLHAIAADMAAGAWGGMPARANREDSALKRLANAVTGQAVLRLGARNFCAAALPRERLGMAVWIDDGAPRAVVAAMAGLLRLHATLPDAAVATIDELVGLRNDMGIVTGRLRLHMNGDATVEGRP